MTNVDIEDYDEDRVLTEQIRAQRALREEEDLANSWSPILIAVAFGLLIVFFSLFFR